MKAMMIAKIKTAAAVICAVTVLGLGGGAAYQLAAAEPKPTKVEKGEKEAKAEKKLNPKIMAMKDNTWLKMNPKKEPQGRNYSGACLGDWGQGARIFYFGGGHVSYDGDDVVLYDPVANTWTSQYEPERYSNKESLRDSEYQPRKIRKTGRPAPHHTYQRVCWVPDRKVFFYVSYDSVWEFDPARAKWRPLAGKYSKDPSKKIPKARAAAWHAFYSPELKAPVGIVRGGNGGVYTFDYKKAEWTRKGARKGASVVGETYSTQIPSLGVQLISGSGKGFWTYEFKTGKLKKLEGIPEALLAGLAGCQALAYDSANDVVIAMPRMPRVKKKAYKPVPVWKLDPKTMKWTELKPEGAAPAGAAQWAPLWYDPDHNAFFFLNRRGQSGCETWAYRYKRKKESK